MKEIFISYSTIDIAQAETVRNVLEKNGLSGWMAPRDIQQERPFFSLGGCPYSFPFDSLHLQSQQQYLESRS